MLARTSHTTLAALLLCLLPLVAAAESPPSAKSPEEDLSTLLPKAEAGDLDACNEVALRYMTQKPPDFASALHWGRKAALAGHVEAQANVGFIYRLQGDIKRAITWTKLAADRGHVGAQFSLSSYYGEHDKVQALKYLILASRTDQDAAFRLQWNTLGATPQERQQAELLAKAWKPVCPGVCHSVLGIDRCGICPLTEKEKRGESPSGPR